MQDALEDLSFRHVQESCQYLVNCIYRVAGVMDPFHHFKKLDAVITD